MLDELLAGSSSTAAAATLLLGVATLLALHLVREARTRTCKLGPTEWPLVGSLFWMLPRRDRILEAVLHSFKAYNWVTWSTKWVFGGGRYFFIASPDNVQHVLQTRFDNYPKGPTFHARLSDLLGDGIFTADGETWRTQRKLASHMFSLASFRGSIMEAFNKHGVVLKRILTRAAASGEVIDVQSLFHRFTLDSIGLIAFGVEIGCLEDPSHPFARAFDRAQALVERRFFLPGWQVLEHLNGTRAELNAALTVMNEYAASLIAARRAAGNYEGQSDLLSRCLAMAAEGVGIDGAPSSFTFTDAFLRDVIMNFMIAGRDTTAQALSWTVHCLNLPATKKEVEARVAIEAAALLSRVPEPSYDDVTRHLRYASAVVLETLRLYPSVPKDVKQAVEDDTLPDGTIIPAGSFVTYCPHAMGRNPSLWGPNADVFDPDTHFWSGALPPATAAEAAAASGRSAGDADDKKESAGGGGSGAGARGLQRHSPFKAIAFNAGPRTCLGQHMALVEASYVLATVYSGFKLIPVPGQVIDYQESLTLPQKSGLKVTVQRR